MGYTDLRRAALALTTVLAVATAAAPASAEVAGATAGAQPAAAKIASSALGSCAITPATTLHCWGEGEDGQLLTGDDKAVGNAAGATTVEVKLYGGVVPAQVSSGYAHTCVVSTKGSVYCWGRDINGQVGDGSTGNARGDAPGETAFKVPLPGGATAKAVAAGREHTCALLSSGDVACWGNNSSGQIGNGTTKDGFTPPTVVNLGAKATAVSTRDSTTCALLTTGDLRCWGANGLSGTAGVAPGSGAPLLTPTAPTVFPAGTTLSAVSVGNNFGCAISTAGAVLCWGEGARGQLSNGTSLGTFSTSKSNPTPNVASTVALGAPATAISTGNERACALAAGAVRCWGDNPSGSLGGGFVGNNWGDDPNETQPITVDLGAGRTPVALGVGGMHTCVLLSAGSPLCFGEGGSGQLASGQGADTGTTPPSALQPVVYGKNVSLGGTLKLKTTLKPKGKSCPKTVKVSVDTSEADLSAKAPLTKKKVSGKVVCGLDATVKWADAPAPGTKVSVSLGGTGLQPKTLKGVAVTA